MRHCTSLSCGTNRAREMNFGIGRVRYMSGGLARQRGYCYHMSHGHGFFSGGLLSNFTKHTLFCNCENASSKASLFFLKFVSNQNEIVVRQASELSQLLPRSKMIKMECGVVDRNRIWLSAPAFGVRHHQLRAVSGHTPRSLKLLVIRLSPGRLRRFLCQRA